MAKQKKDDEIKVRATEELKNKALNKAMSKGLTLSAYVTMLITEDVKKVD